MFHELLSKGFIMKRLRKRKHSSMIVGRSLKAGDESFKSLYDEIPHDNLVFLLSIFKKVDKCVETFKHNQRALEICLEFYSLADSILILETFAKHYLNYKGRKAA